MGREKTGIPLCLGELATRWPPQLGVTAEYEGPCRLLRALRPDSGVVPRTNWMHSSALLLVKTKGYRGNRSEAREVSLAEFKRPSARTFRWSLAFIVHP